MPFLVLVRYTGYAWLSYLDGLSMKFVFAFNKIRVSEGRRTLLRYGTDRLVNITLLVAFENPLEIALALYLNVIKQSFETIGGRTSKYTITSLSFSSWFTCHLSFIIK